MKESDLHKYTKAQCKAKQVLFYKLTCVGKRGFPDIMLIKDGHILLVELKSPSGKGVLSELQKREISRLRNDGVHVYVADSTTTIDSLLTLITGSTDA
jgi:hypothetical protein